MDTNLEHALTKLAKGSVLRIEGGQGQAVAVFRGLVWITQEGDTRDVILADGESFTLDRPGLAVVQALLDSDLLRIEKDGLPRDTVHAAHVDPYALHARARELRAQAFADGAHRVAALARSWWAERATRATT